MTNEEAIEMFSVAVTAELCERNRDLYRIAIKALEKQISKKVIWKFGGDGFPYPYCSACGDSIMYSDYCDNCGQRLDWSEENEQIH